MMMQAITFHRSKHVAIRDLTVLNGQQMHIAFTSCSHVRASRLKVTAPAESPNTDGIHISGSIATLVEDSTIRTGPYHYDYLQCYLLLLFSFFSFPFLFIFEFLAFQMVHRKPNIFNNIYSIFYSGLKLIGHIIVLL